MTKQPRIEKEEEESDSEIDKSEQKYVSPDLFQQFGNFIAFCSDLEANTEQNELRTFLSKFGKIQFLWLEDINGQGNRQALIFFSSQEQLDNLIQNKYLNFTSLITVEQFSQQLKEISEMFLIAFYEKDPIQQKIKAQQYYQQGFIRYIHNLLEQINENQIEGRIPQGRFLTLPANYHLITKFGCYLLSFILNLHPLSAKAAINYKILQQIMNLISTLPLYYINDYHTQILFSLMRKSNDASKREILANGGLQTLSRLLDHTNLKIKMDVITSMFDILYTEEFRQTTRAIHPLYSEAKNDGVIFQVYQNCLIHCDNDFLMDNSAIILSTLMRGQEVDQKMKHPLFQRLKSVISKGKPLDLVRYLLDLLCGLAINEGNISEIASENFIKTGVNLSQSSDQTIHYNALELLFRLAEKGTELENEILNQINIFDFLKLIGDSSTQFDDQILAFLMKHSDDEQLVNIHNIFDIVKRFIIINEQEKIEVLTNEFISTILTLLSKENEQVILQEQNNNPIQPFTFGLINCICRSIIQVVSLQKNSKNQIIQTDILSLIVKILNHLQNRQIKSLYFEVFEIFTNINSSNYNLTQSRIDITQFLSKILENPTNINNQQALRIISINIKSGLSISTSSDNFKLYIPQTYKNTFFDNLKDNGIIDILQKLALNHNISKYLTQEIIQTLIYAFQGQQFPSELLNTAVFLLEEKIQYKLLVNDNIINEIPLLVILSCHQRNIETIMNSEIVKILYSYIDKVDPTTKNHITQLFNILLINGNENILQKFKAVISVDLLESLIKRQNYAHLFNIYNNNEQKQKQKIAISDLNINKLIFTLIAWHQEEDKMIKLSKLRNELIQLIFGYQNQNDEINNQINSNQIENEQNINKENQIELFEKKEKQNEGLEGKMKELNKLNQLEDEIQNQQKNQNETHILNNNKWDIVKKMILIVNEFRDKELSQGAMQIVQEAIFIILFDQLKNSKDIQLVNSVDFFHQIIENADNDICLNLIDQQIFDWFIFSILEYYHRQQFGIVEKIISLFALILKRGVIMGNYRELNHLFTNTKILLLDFLQKILEEKQNDEDNEEIKQLKERIKLQVAFCFSCMKKNWLINENIFNICSSLFFNMLNKFNQILQENEKVNSLELNSELNQVQSVGSSKIKTILNVLTSISCLAIPTNQKQILVNQYKIHEVILPLIHLNCNCPLRFTIADQKSASDVVSSAFDSLYLLVSDIEEDEINKINLKHNIIDHLKPFITKSSELDILDDESLLDSFSIELPYNLTPHLKQQSNIALKLLYHLIKKSTLISEQDFSKLAFENLSKISIEQVKVNPQKPNESSDDQQDSQQTDIAVINTQVAESLNSYEDIIDLSGMISSLMNDESGNSNDEDETLRADIKNICYCIDIVNRYIQNEIELIDQIKKLWIGIKEKLEEDGIIDEDDALLFHTDTRSNYGVRYFAKKLKSFLNILLGQ